MRAGRENGQGRPLLYREAFNVASTISGVIDCVLVVSCVLRQGKPEDGILPLVSLQEKHVETENIMPGAITTAQ